MRLAAPAKVNLGLAVLARRGDGYHEVETLMARLDLADEVAVSVRQDRPGAVTLAVRPEPAPSDPVWHAAALADVPTGVDNLAVQAARAYQQAYQAQAGAAAPGVHIDLMKRVPVAAGLGGGSSDAAAVLLAMEAQLRAGLELDKIASALGSDVPFFVAGARAAVARGRGERLHPVEMPRLALVLAKPEITVSAADAYAALVGFTPRLKHEAALAALTAGEEPRWRNGLQAGVVRAHPSLRALLEEMRGTGLRGVLMSGSGPTCFGVADDLGAAQAAAHELARRHPELWVRAASTA